MRRKDREITDETDMVAFLQSQSAGSLSLASPSGPYCVPVNYLYLDGCIYFHCAMKGRKIESIQKDSRVCFMVDQRGPQVLWQRRCGITQVYKSVICFGHAETISDFTVKKNILTKMVEKYVPEKYEYSSMNDMYVRETCVVKITVTEMTGKENRLSAEHRVIEK